MGDRSIVERAYRPLAESRWYRPSGVASVLALLFVVLCVVGMLLAYQAPWIVTAEAAAGVRSAGRAPALRDEPPRDGWGRPSR